MRSLVVWTAQDQKNQLVDEVAHTRRKKGCENEETKRVQMKRQTFQRTRRIEGQKSNEYEVVA